MIHFLQFYITIVKRNRRRIMKIYINKKNDDLHDAKNGYGHFYIIDYEIEIDMEPDDYILHDGDQYGLHYKRPRKDQADKYFDNCTATTKKDYCAEFVLHILRLLWLS